jgi:hypothetical protein
MMPTGSVGEDRAAHEKEEGVMRPRGDKRHVLPVAVEAVVAD